MAGILGVLSSKDLRSIGLDPPVIKAMERALKYDDRQLVESISGDTFFFSSALPVSKKNNDRFFCNSDLGVICGVDGFIKLRTDSRMLLLRKFNLSEHLTNYELLPYLYKYYGEDLPLSVTGSFNLFIFEKESKQLIVVNDRLGFYPLHYYSNDSVFVFGSRIEVILASKLLEQTAMDITTIAEYLYFGYPVSDNTFIKNVNTLPNASSIRVSDSGFQKRTYWEIGDDFTKITLSKADSLDHIDFALLKSVKTCLAHIHGCINLSLTGGWDSRLILAYLLPEHRSDLCCYSFGAAESDDIQVPKNIAQKENLAYTPFVLDSDYMRNSFITAAKDTVLLSGGMRSYKRSHYFHAIKEIGYRSDNVLTGIFGDEVLKIGRPQGGVVISPNIITMLDDGLDPKRTLDRFLNSAISKLPFIIHTNTPSELVSRITGLQEKLKKYPRKAEQYIAFRFEINLRKYFGYEASSYNDFAYCFSPFIDYDFIAAWMKTVYAGHRYSFTKTSLTEQKQSVDLYTQLVMRQFPRLAYYISSRGYSMADTQNLLGKVKILCKKRFGKPVVQDAFNTLGTDVIFKSSFRDSTDDCYSLSMDESLYEDRYQYSNALSLFYWLRVIQKEYL